jgi:AraC-like DNA-binding protein
MQARGQRQDELRRRMHKAKAMMDVSFRDPLDLARISAFAGCSQFQLIRGFRAEYGETPRRYLTLRRMERAMHYLRMTDLPVAEVGRHVGFASHGSFTRRFTELIGWSPSAFREECTRLGRVPDISGSAVHRCAALRRK